MRYRILEAVNKYAKLNATRLHMPGHKGSKDFCAKFLGGKIDVTELDAIDNEAVRKKAEQDCAQILGVKYLRFITDGATCGILSSLYAVKHLGEKIIITRSAHKSVFNALKLCGIEPIVIDTGVKDGLVLPPTKEQTERVLNQNGVIGAIFTYPDYYGNTFEIEEIYTLLKQKGKVLIVDNSHGGHFKFFEGLKYAGQSADITVDSAHKTFETLTQGAYVTCNNSELIEGLTFAIELFSTTSPSYPILASIEYGIKKMASLKSERLTAFSNTVCELKRKIGALGFRVVQNEDVYKLAIDFLGANISTNKAKKVLEKNEVFYELNDGRYIVFMFSIKTTKKDFENLLKAIKQIKKLYGVKNKKVTEKQFEFGERQVDYLTAVNEKNVEVVKLCQAVGRVSADNVGIFPPCFPLIIAGERINERTADFLSKNKNTFGLTDKGIRVLK